MILAALYFLPEVKLLFSYTGLFYLIILLTSVTRVALICLKAVLLRIVS